MYRIKANPSHWLIIRTVPRIFSPSQRSNESITWCVHLRIYNDPTVRPNSISKRFHGDSGPRITWHGRLASNGFTAAENIGISIRRFVFWFIRCPDFAISPSLAEACNDIYIYIYTRLSGWANKVPYIGYDGGRCREHNGSLLPTSAARRLSS